MCIYRLVAVICKSLKFREIKKKMCNLKDDILKEIVLCMIPPHGKKCHSQHSIYSIN